MLWGDTFVSMCVSFFVLVCVCVCVHCSTAGVLLSVIVSHRFRSRCWRVEGLCTTARGSKSKKNKMPVKLCSLSNHLFRLHSSGLFSTMLDALPFRPQLSWVGWTQEENLLLFGDVWLISQKEGSDRQGFRLKILCLPCYILQLNLKCYD